MFKAILKHATGFVGLVCLLVIVNLVAVTSIRHLHSDVLASDKALATRTAELSERLKREGQDVKSLNTSVVNHLVTIRDGGQLTDAQGLVWHLSASSDSSQLQAIKAISAAMRAKDEPAYVTAFAALANQQNQAFSQRRAQIQWAEFAALLFAVLSSLFAVWGMSQRLGRAERHAAKVSAESDQILASVDSGLFLVGKDNQISAKKSAAVNDILGWQFPIEGDFFGVLRNLVSAANLELTREYIELLREGRVVPALMQDVNPLQELPVQVIDANGQAHLKFLDFSFTHDEARDGRGDILVTVVDVTEEIQLRRELESTKAMQKERMSLFVGLLHVEPEKLNGFCDRAATELRVMNRILADESLSQAEFRTKLDDIFRSAHRIKGDAASLGLPLFENAMHRFEGQIKSLQKLEIMDGRDLLELTVRLKEMIQETDVVRSLVPQLKTLALDAVEEDDDSKISMSLMAQSELPESQRAFAEGLGNLVQHVSQRQGKHAVLDINGLELLDQNPAISEKVQTITTQLVRNSVVHGIEPPQIRQIKDKSGFGVVNVNIKSKSDQAIQLVVRDDGQGLNFEKIKERAVKQNLLNAKDASNVENRALLRYLFLPGFSSKDSADLDGGRGVGLDAVREDLTRLGGRVSISSKAGRYTKFVMEIPVVAGGR